MSLKVAYSGGVDSHALLHALCQLRDTIPWPISALHIDHGIHPDSRAWATHCRHVCQGLDIPCAVERVEVTATGEEGLEATARRLRYGRLARHIGPADVLLTAHHLDDQAETVLLQLVRGGGVRGLAGMPVVAEFAAGRLMRPLLGFARSELIAYAREQQLQWIEDSSNRDLRYARNLIRHRVLPLLEQRWPRVKDVLARASRHAGETAQLLDEIARADLEAARLGVARTLSVTRLLGLSRERRGNVLRYWIRHRGFPAPSALVLKRIGSIVDKPTRSGSAVVAWPGAEVRRYRDDLSIMLPLVDPDPRLKLPWDPAVPLAVPGTGYVIRTTAVVGKGLSQERIAAEPLTVRLRQGGETCQLPGRRHHHKLKKLLQDAGVPPWERCRLPLIFAGEGLAAVADRWVCTPFAAAAGEPGLQVLLEQVDVA